MNTEVNKCFCQQAFKIFLGKWLCYDCSKSQFLRFIQFQKQFFKKIVQKIYQVVYEFTVLRKRHKHQKKICPFAKHVFLNEEPDWSHSSSWLIYRWKSPPSTIHMAREGWAKNGVLPFLKFSLRSEKVLYKCSSCASPGHIAFSFGQWSGTAGFSNVWSRERRQRPWERRCEAAP